LIDQVCQELEGLDAIGPNQNLCPRSLEEVERMIYEQNQILGQLETQRPGIVSLLQAGQDLQHDGNTPDFVLTQSQELEGVWNEIFNRAYEKLWNLQGKAVAQK